MRSWSEITHDLQVNWPIYASMPFIAALIGWFTKLVAIKMMFRPHKFRGIGPLGWQGIIPKRAPQMVEVLCQTLTGRLISAEDIISRVDGKQLAREINRPLRREVARLVPLIAEEYQPAVWRILPGAARDLVIQRAQDVASDMVPALVKALRKNIDDVFDLQEMVTYEFLADPDILEKMFLDVGKREFAFIRRSGLCFGFVIGFLQAAIWAATHNPLVMPVFGLFIGWFTDWAALRLIFNPKEPKKYLGVVTWQGLFLKHRIPVSEEYGRLIATRVLTADRIVRFMFTGPRRGEVVELLRQGHRQGAAQRVHRHRQEPHPGAGEVQHPWAGAGHATSSRWAGCSVRSPAWSTKPVRDLAGGALEVAKVGPMSHAAADELVGALPEILASADGYLEKQPRHRADHVGEDGRDDARGVRGRPAAGLPGRRAHPDHGRRRPRLPGRRAPGDLRRAPLPLEASRGCDLHHNALRKLYAACKFLLTQGRQPHPTPIPGDRHG